MGFGQCLHAAYSYHRRNLYYAIGSIKTSMSFQGFATLILLLLAYF